MALTEIRDKKLYSDVLGFETFEGYCKERWDMSRPRAYQLIDAVEIKNNLSTVVDIPERQIRPLAKLEPQQQREAWQKAVETAPEGKVTAAHVSKVVKSLVVDVKKEKAIKIEKQAHEDKILDEDFKKAYDAFHYEVMRVHKEEWKTVKKETVLKYTMFIIDLINI